jgi:hypothetical protein
VLNSNLKSSQIQHSNNSQITFKFLYTVYPINAIDSNIPGNEYAIWPGARMRAAHALARRLVCTVARLHPTYSHGSRYSSSAAALEGAQRDLYWIEKPLSGAERPQSTVEDNHARDSRLKSSADTAVDAVDSPVGALGSRPAQIPNEISSSARVPQTVSSRSAPKSSSRARVRHGLRHLIQDPSWAKTVALWNKHSNNSLRSVLLDQLKARNEQNTLELSMLLDSLWLQLADLVENQHNKSVDSQVYRSKRGHFLGHGRSCFTSMATHWLSRPLMLHGSARSKLLGS